MKLKYPSSFPLPEIVGAGGSLQGDQGSVMTPGFPGQNYMDGALYQVHRHTLKSVFSKKKMECILFYLSSNN